MCVNNGKLNGRAGKHSHGNDVATAECARAEGAVVCIIKVSPESACQMEWY